MRTFATFSLNLSEHPENVNKYALGSGFSMVCCGLVTIDIAHDWTITFSFSLKVQPVPGEHAACVKDI